MWSLFRLFAMRSTMADAKKLTLKLVVDKKRKRVVFAESNKDFVDILFSFLTLPMGTIVRLLGKKSMVGCMDNLYESVQNLDVRYLETEACRTMLLHPRGPSDVRCEDLTLNIDDRETRKFYICKKPECSIGTSRFFSSVQNARCRCGLVMDFTLERAKEVIKGSADDGVFVKGNIGFIITDDLHVTLASSAPVLALLNNLGIRDGSVLEERIMYLGTEEILNLLKRSLLSKKPLSDICFQEPDLIVDHVGFLAKDVNHIKVETDTEIESERIKAKLLVSKSDNKVLYAEAGDDIADLLFSFLTFPLGSIVKLLDKRSFTGCIKNLYNSIQIMSTGEDCMISEECKSLLLAPKLAPYFGCSKQLLMIDEKPGFSGTVSGCHTCFSGKKGSYGTTNCMHGVKHVTLSEMNPKRPAGNETGGGFARKGVKFIVTDELEVTPFSPSSIIQIANRLKTLTIDMEEREVNLGEIEVLNLLNACLISRNPLTDVFSRQKSRRQSTFAA